MHPRLLEGIDYIQATRAELIASFDGVSSDRLHARRNPGEWSAAQVIEHLRMVEGGIARLFAKRIAQAKAAGLRHEDSTQSILGGLDDVADTLQYGKIDAPDTVKPPEEVDLDSAVAGLATTRTALIDAVSRSETSSTRIPFWASWTSTSG
jgi:uncharacterized damage-inducible protein DinB